MSVPSPLAFLVFLKYGNPSPLYPLEFLFLNKIKLRVMWPSLGVCLLWAPNTGVGATAQKQVPVGGSAGLFRSVDSPVRAC